MFKKFCSTYCFTGKKNLEKVPYFCFGTRRYNGSYGQCSEETSGPKIEMADVGRLFGSDGHIPAHL